MWHIIESDDARKSIDRLPHHIAEKYEVWRRTVIAYGPQGLRASPGSFNDEKLHGELAAFRSSRLSKPWRVIYSVHANVVTVLVKRVEHHVYRR